MSQAQGILHLAKKGAKREGFVAFQLQPPLLHSTQKHIISSSPL
jgi:hypothetical protein